MKWTFHNAKEGFQQHRAQWDDLNSRIDNHILLDSKFWEVLVEFFSNEKTLLAISHNSEYPGIALLENVGYGMWGTFQPSQAPLGPILLGNPENIEGQLKELLQCLPGYALGIGVTQQDPSFSHFNSLRVHRAAEVKNYVKTARISVQGNFDEYWASRGNDLKRNVRKRLNRLEREGIRTDTTVHQTPEEMKHCIQEYGQLEELGWKGKGGTAVSPNNIQGMFYQSMLERICQAGEGVVYSLRFNDKIVAQKICVRRNKMMVFLKMAYDENYRHLAPGYLLQYEILKRLFEDHEIETVETYGRVNEGWTDKWTNDFRTMYHINYFRHMGLMLAKNVFDGSPLETQTIH